MAANITLSDSEPNLLDHITVEEYDEATPTSFFDGRPVLHYYDDDCYTIIDRAAASNFEELAIALGFHLPLSGASNGNMTHVSSASQTLVAEHVKIMVTSE